MPPWYILNGGTVPPFNLFLKFKYHVSIFFELRFPFRKRLNGGTVPPFKMHHGGTVPPLKMHHGGTVPPCKMHHRETVPPFKMHHGGTMNFGKTKFRGNWQNPNTTTTQHSLNRGWGCHDYHFSARQHHILKLKLYRKEKS